MVLDEEYRVLTTVTLTVKQHEWAVPCTPLDHSRRSHSNTRGCTFVGPIRGGHLIVSTLCSIPNTNIRTHDCIRVVWSGPKCIKLNFMGL